MPKGELRICDKGHKYYKSSDCPVCPVCEKEKKKPDNFLGELSSPARSALEHEGITTLEKLAEYTEKQILSLHGMGPASIPTLKKSLASKGLAFKM